MEMTHSAFKNAAFKCDICRCGMSAKIGTITKCNWLSGGMAFLGKSCIIRFINRFHHTAERRRYQYEIRNYRKYSLSRERPIQDFDLWGQVHSHSKREADGQRGQHGEAMPDSRESTGALDVGMKKPAGGGGLGSHSESGRGRKETGPEQSTST